MAAARADDLCVNAGADARFLLSAADFRRQPVAAPGTG
jgi:hypothetical protein